jgi:methylenetetrahydrofolate reductase (NADPH)
MTKKIHGAKQFTFSFEVFPPKKEVEDLSDIFTTILKLKKFNPDFISVTYGASGNNVGRVQEIAHFIENTAKLTALSHLTCVASKKEDIIRICTDLKKANISNILTLRGDIPGQAETAKDFMHASDLASFITKTFPQDFTLGGACYPEVHPEAISAQSDLDFLSTKIDSGVSFLISQLFFDNALFYDFVNRARANNITVPIIAGIMPITSVKTILKITQLSHAAIPDDLKKQLLALSEDDKEGAYKLGVAYASKQIIDLIDHNVDGIHLYIMNNYQLAFDIYQNIKHKLK